MVHWAGLAQYCWVITPGLTHCYGKGIAEEHPSQSLATRYNPSSVLILTRAVHPFRVVSESYWCRVNAFCVLLYRRPEFPPLRNLKRQRAYGPVRVSSCCLFATSLVRNLVKFLQMALGKRFGSCFFCQMGLHHAALCCVIGSITLI